MRWREKEVARELPRSMDATILTLRAYGNKHRYTPEAYRSARADLEEALPWSVVKMFQKCSKDAPEACFDVSRAALKGERAAFSHRYS